MNNVVKVLKIRILSANLYNMLLIIMVKTMKKLVLIIAICIGFTACSITTDGAISTQRGVTTTGNNLTSSTDTTTDASKSTSGDKKNTNWEYDEGQTR